MQANACLQPMFNRNASNPGIARCERPCGRAPWVVGDRVISHDKIEANDGGCVFNGMTGTVVEIKGRRVVVEFDAAPTRPRHTFAAADKSIDHAYCITTWKYQGSKAKAVVVFFAAALRRQGGGEIAFRVALRME